MKHENVKKMAALALLAALVVVLQTVASGIKVGPIPITLTLVPIVIGAVLYGPARAQDSARSSGWSRRSPV